MARLLQYRSDWRSVAVTALVTATFVVQWFVVDRWSAPLFLLSIILSLQVAVIAHNHFHHPIWKLRGLNALHSYWLTLAYGLPMLSWLAIHNRSHHVHGNRPEVDCTSTHNVSDRNDLLGLLLYAPACSKGFWRAHGSALARYARTDRRKLVLHISHILLLWGALALAFVTDWRKALLYVVIPQQVAIASITVFNFCQHAHADAGTKYNLTRNFVGTTLNAYLFNAGYHTVHHLQPKLHWSLLPAEHARIAHHVDARLNIERFWSYFFGVVVRGTFSRRFRSTALTSS